MEHVAGCQMGLPVGTNVPFGAFQIAISTYDLLGLRIPHNQLLVAVLTGVELINVAIFTRSTSCLAEGNLA